MRLPWKKRPEEEEFYMERPKKKEETLMQVADKILKKKMKSDNEYGITAAEKLKNIHHGAPKTRSDFLKEMIEEDELKREAGIGGGGGEGGNPSWLKTVLEVFGPMIAEAIKSAAAAQMQAQAGRPRIQVQEAPAEQIEQGRAAAQPQPQPKLDQKIETLLSLLALDAPTAWETLKNDNQQGWINFLSTTSVEEAEASMRKYAEDSGNPDYVEGIESFLAQQHHWLQELIELAHSEQKK